jgi:hypothetical protein
MFILHCHICSSALVTDGTIQVTDIQVTGEVRYSFFVPFYHSLQDSCFLILLNFSASLSLKFLSNM